MRVEPTGFVTIPMVAERLGIGDTPIRLAIKRGDLPCYQLGRVARVRWADVLTWVERQRRPRRPGTTAAP